MHLAQGFSTVRTNRKLQPKMTKTNIEKWSKDLHSHNKMLKRLGQPKMTFEEYVDYLHGRVKPTKKRFSEYTANRPASYRETPAYPSRDSGTGVAAKTETMKYTGTLVKGIATMHKSNAVPIIDDQQAKDISSMRR